jgi:hypothetical protein
MRGPHTLKVHSESGIRLNQTSSQSKRWIFSKALRPHGGNNPANNSVYLLSGLSILPDVSTSIFLLTSLSLKPVTDTIDLSGVDGQEGINSVYSTILFHALRNHVAGLSCDEIIDRHSSIYSVEPDFALTVRRRHPDRLSLEEAFRVKTTHARQQVLDVLMYGSNELAAEHAIPGVFGGIPGCWVRR